MSFCRNCGNEIPEGTKFCPNCGTAVEITDDQVLPGGEKKFADNMPEIQQPADTATTPEKKENRFDKYSKFCGIVLLIIAFTDFYTDPAIFTILLSVAVIAACIFCLSRKYKLKGFTIIALILAAFCLLSGIKQAKKTGLFTMPKNAYAYSEDTGDIGTEDPDTNEEITEETTEDTTEETSEETTEETTEETIEDDAAVQDKAADEIEPAAEETGAGSVDPDLKAYLDSYEAFIDEYVVFMKKYTSDPGNVISMLSEYTEIMEKYQEFSDKIDDYDTDSMSDADLKYYLDVTTRCTEKMLEIY